jgi:hypothetical protein
MRRYVRFLICQIALSVAIYFGVQHMVHFLIVQSGYAYLQCGIVALEYYITHMQPGALGNCKSPMQIDHEKWIALYEC